MKDHTKVVHRPPVDESGYASLAVPVQRGSTIVFDTAAAYIDRRQRGPDGYAYGLHGTPTTKTLEAQLSALEGAAHTAVLPSGQAAIALLFLALLAPGDEALIPDNVYPPVRRLCAETLAPLGIRHRLYDPLAGGDIAQAFGPTTRLLWTETPGSATMEIGDIPAFVAAARERSILVGCDNSWATPLLFKPLALGVDCSMQALTKYVGGHSDLLLGSVSFADRALYMKIRAASHNLGIGVSPDDCALALRGLETLGVRLTHIGRVSTDFAQRLCGHPAVARVLHPALPGHPGHALWARDYAGASGLFSIVLHPVPRDRLHAALEGMSLFVMGASWGGTRSLIAPMTVERTIGPLPAGGPLLRLSIGLEDADDLWADLAGMLDRLTGAAA